MKKGDIITGKIKTMRFPNKGILHAEDMRIVVKNALPGQVVSARVTKKRQGRCEASLLEVEEHAENERRVRCPQYGSCGGCLYLCFPYEEELKIKEQQIRELLAEADPAAERCLEGILPSPVHEQYRNKMEFTFGNAYKDGPLTLGMHRRGSFYDLTDAGECELIDADYRKIVRLSADFFRERNIPFYHRMRKEGYLRHLLVRKASHTGEILVDLVTTTQTESFSEAFSEEELLCAYKDLLLSASMDGVLKGILHTRNDSAADIVEDQGTDILWGEGAFKEKLLGLDFIVTPFSFFQTNSYGAEVLYETAGRYIRAAGEKLKERTGLAKDPVVFDLYCGTGTISQLTAPYASKVVGVEIVEEAVEAARENAVRNGIGNCSFLCGDVLKVIDTIEEKPDLIILDPPRDGIHPKAMPKILAFGVEYILYISCKASSLARDLPLFAEGGYRPVRSCIVDQFPRTANTEVICLLEKA